MGELTNLPDGRVFLCNGAQIGDILVQTYILCAMYTAYVYHTCMMYPPMYICIYVTAPSLCVTQSCC